MHDSARQASRALSAASLSPHVARNGRIRAVAPHPSRPVAAVATRVVARPATQRRNLDLVLQGGLVYLQFGSVRAT